MCQYQKVNTYITAYLSQLYFLPSTGTWVTFGGQISDEVSHGSPFAWTFDSAVTGVEQP